MLTNKTKRVLEDLLEVSMELVVLVDSKVFMINSDKEEVEVKEPILLEMFLKNSRNFSQEVNKVKNAEQQQLKERI
jgi:hypothetical protein